MFGQMTPEDQAQLSMAMRLIGGSGPSTSPVGFGQALGNAGIGAMGDYNSLIAAALERKQAEKMMDLRERQMKQEYNMQSMGMDLRKQELDYNIGQAEAKRADADAKTKGFETLKSAVLGAPLASLAMEQKEPATAYQQAGLVMAANAPDIATFQTGIGQVYPKPEKPMPLQLKQVWDPTTQTATYVPEVQALGRTAPPPVGYMSTPPIYSPQQAETPTDPFDLRDYLDKTLKLAKSRLVPKAQLDSLQDEFKRADEKVKSLNDGVEKLSKRYEEGGITGLTGAMEEVGKIMESYPEGKDIPGIGQTAKVPDEFLSKEGIAARQALVSLGNMMVKARTGLAMPESEAIRLGSEMGLSFENGVFTINALKSDESVRTALPRVFSEIHRYVQNAETASPEVVDLYRKRKGPVASERTGAIMERLTLKDPGQPLGAAQNQSGLPRQGEVVDGYIYIGGDPAQESSWKPQ